MNQPKRLIETHIYFSECYMIKIEHSEELNFVLYEYVINCHDC